MALAEIKKALTLYLVDTYNKENSTDYEAIATFVLKTRAQQKAILQAWATAKKADLTTKKSALATAKTAQEALFDAAIADITDLESNF